MDNDSFTEEIIWQKEKFKVTVSSDIDYQNLKNINQVYGFIFNQNHEILIIHSSKKGWSLPGGTPESYDKDWKETLKREVIEEANVEIENIIPAGHISSEPFDKNSKGKSGIGLRAIAQVKRINPQKEDPATGEINERKFINPDKFLEYCLWGKNGKKQLEIALRVKKRDSLPFRKNCEGYFINSDGNILAKKSDSGFIIFPGGGVDEIERIEEAMVRETLEETGAVIKSLKNLGLVNFIWDINWAKTEKQRKRYEQFKGDEMHFFSGKVIKFVNSNKTEEDYWKGNKFMSIDEVLKAVRSRLDLEPDSEYVKVQLRILTNLKEELD